MSTDSPIDAYGRLPCQHCGSLQHEESPFCLACGRDSPVAPEWACGYLIEYDDDGPVDRIVVRVGPQHIAERTAVALEKIAVIHHDTARPVSHGIVFTCPIAMIDFGEAQ